MNYKDFKIAKTFIYTDIERELRLAELSQSNQGKQNLDALGIHEGGANFMATLGLLCYTEFVGKLKFSHLSPSKNFNDFFDELGEDYKSFRRSHNVYNILRCGLAHEYFIKKDCTIAMFSDSPMGVLFQNNRYIFIVKKYFEDFKRAFEIFENEKYSNTI